MIPGAEMRARLDDRIGVAAVTYLLFGVKLGPALALSVVLVFAIWVGWRWLQGNISSRLSRFTLIKPQPADPRASLGGEPSALCLDAMMADGVGSGRQPRKPWSVVYGATLGPRVARESSNLAGESKPAAGVVDICRGVSYRRAG